MSRRNRLQQTCSQHKDGFKFPACELKDVKFNLKYINTSNILYCAIEKTGSTFWKRILHVIGGWGNTSNPTNIKAADADTDHGGFGTFKGRSWKDVTRAFDTSSNIMFVRDPFTRAFSAWLDKFYNPNVYYWNTTGKTIKSWRPKATKDSPFKCGHDISFIEFIQFLVKTVPNGCLDGHFSPNHKHCLQCNYTYDYIGKYETLQEDTYYLLQKLNLTHTVIFTDFQSDAAYDAIKGVSAWIIKQKEDILKCGVSMRCAMFRAWKRFQARGIISKNVEFPFNSEEEALNLTKGQLIEKFYTYHKLGDAKKMKQNRKEALAHAFKLLPGDLLEEFKTVFKEDFDMFDYDPHPEYLSELSSDNFNYFERCPDALF